MAAYKSTAFQFSLRLPESDRLKIEQQPLLSRLGPTASCSLSVSRGRRKFAHLLLAKTQTDSRFRLASLAKPVKHACQPGSAVFNVQKPSLTYLPSFRKLPTTYTSTSLAFFRGERRSILSPFSSRTRAE